jgi:F-type H+-transporting ATPase subunit b
MLSFNISFLIELGLFLVVMISLNFLVFKPLARLHDHREKTVNDLQEGLDSLEKARSDRSVSYEKHIEDLKSEIQIYKNGIRETMNNEKRTILGEAHKKANLILQKEGADMKSDLAAAQKQLREQSHQLAEIVFRKVMGRSPGAAH